MDPRWSAELEPPYEIIAKALKEGQVVPFLGAGVNVAPPAPEPQMGQAEVARLPSGFELSRVLANASRFPAESDEEREDLAKVASFFVDNGGRRRLRATLHETFNKDFSPCKIHQYLAEIPRPLLIVTTNYDDLTEKAFEAKGRPYDLVVHPTDRTDLAGSVLWWKHGASKAEAQAPNTLPMMERLEEISVIYKMH